LAVYEDEALLALLAEVGVTWSLTEDRASSIPAA
jgi:hypothetical protein